MMNQIRSAVFLVIALFYVVASSGLVIIAHTCQADGATEVTLFTRSGCCSEITAPCHDDADTWEAPCCQLSMTYDKIEPGPVDSRTASLIPVQIPLMRWDEQLGFREKTTLFTSYRFDRPPPSAPFYGVGIGLSIGRWQV